MAENGARTLKGDFVGNMSAFHRPDFQALRRENDEQNWNSAWGSLHVALHMPTWKTFCNEGLTPASQCL
jgi:hypothetical protein